MEATIPAEWESIGVGLLEVPCLPEWEGDTRLFMVRALESYCPRVPSHILRFAVLSLLTLSTLLLAGRPSFAQEENTRGKIGGIVKDEAGAPIAGAVIQLFSQVRDTRFELKTDANGHYESGWLQEGQYAVRIEARNFLVDHFG